MLLMLDFKEEALDVPHYQNILGNFVISLYYIKCCILTSQWGPPCVSGREYSRSSFCICWIEMLLLFKSVLPSFIDHLALLNLPTLLLSWKNDYQFSCCCAADPISIKQTHKPNLPCITLVQLVISWSFHCDKSCVCWFLLISEIIM